jgi:hypothetical protein
MATLAAPTLQKLIRETRIFLNQLDPNSSFWSDEELTNYANDGVSQFFQIINDEAEGQFDTTASLDLVAGQDTVSLPSDCFEVRSIYVVQSGQNVMCPYKNNVTDGYMTTGTNTSSTYTPYYYFRSGNIVLRPIPQYSQTGGLLVEYTQFPQSLITGGDSLTSGISPVFKELVVKYICYQAKLKEASVMGGDSHRAIEAHLAALLMQFKQSISGRSKYPQFVIPFEP